MNRPTIDVDELLEVADEAIAAQDYPQAVEILRKATSIAPLRRDIRNRLALALERAPVVRSKSSSQSKPQIVQESIVPAQPEFEPYIEFEDDVLDTDIPGGAPAQSGGRDAIGQIARKAFEAAADHTARAGEATRNLTNLLQQGIKTWKSSLGESAGKAPVNTPVESSRNMKENTTAIASPQSNVFKPEADLHEYLKRAESDDQQLGSQEPDAEELETAEEELRIVKPANVSRKSTSAAPTRRKSQKPADVEDVLAAGIGGFIDALGNLNKTKIAYSIIYISLIGFFGYACIDVSKKFPAVEAVSGNGVQTASLGSLNLNESTTADEAVATARALLNNGKSIEAINLLRTELESGRFLYNRDLVRIELAAILNNVAEQHLRANEFEKSVGRYKEAVEVLPTDNALQLRLGNALYYQGSLGVSTPDLKSKLLNDAAAVLERVMAREPGNLQAHRLSALVAEASGDSSAADILWRKVQALASAGSPEYKEAESHLK